MIPQEDTDFLASKEYSFEVLTEGGNTHVIIKDFPFPSQFYSVEKAELLVKIPSGYPVTPLDMFWTNPIISFVNGTPPPATTERETLHGKEWQRWSRHYDWRVGIDSLKTHISAIRNELKKGT